WTIRRSAIRSRSDSGPRCCRCIFSLTSGFRAERSVSLGHPEQAFGNDAALNLGSSFLDRVAARAQRPILPSPALDRVWRSFLEHRARTLHGERELVHPLIQLAPQELRDRAFGARRAAAQQA